MKRIVICADGTWNSPEEGISTNVLQLSRGIKSRASDGIEQVVFYDWGIGTDRKKLVGGITGEGIDKNIMDCYRFIIHNYEKDDELFFFGFSRGAYTVRSLAGFIRNCGLLKKENAQMIPDAYRLYRKRGPSNSPSQKKSKLFRKENSIANITKIKFIGVWDTVGALGIPVPFWGTLGKENYLFHDTSPSKIVEHARHAISIDENRVDFTPCLWVKKPDVDIKQIWFSGVHADIGGGYKKNGLSHCSCDWIIKEAKALGLECEKFLIKSIIPNFKDKQHNERKGKYLFRKKYVRTIDGFVHPSVRKRFENDVEGYSKKCKPLINLLKSVNNDWNKIEMS